MTVKTVSRSRRSCPRCDYKQLHTFSSADDPTLRLACRRLQMSEENVFIVDCVVASCHRQGENLSVLLLLSFWDWRPLSNSKLLSCRANVLFGGRASHLQMHLGGHSVANKGVLVDLLYCVPSRELYLRELQVIGLFLSEVCYLNFLKSRGQIPLLRPTISELSFLVQENSDFVCEREWRRI